MTSTAPLRRYGPLALLAAVQLTLVLAVPSTGTSPSSTAAGGAGLPPPGVPAASGANAAGAPPATAGGPASAVATGPTALAPVPGGAPAGAAGAPVPVAAASNGPVGGPTRAAGSNGRSPATLTASGSADTSHCVAGRQFDPSIDYYAPPCVPGVPGAAYPNNGGATTTGVSSNRIEMVQYVPDYGSEVDAILKVEGQFYNTANAAKADAAFQKFINAHYELYGRQVHIDAYQGTCQSVPPDYPCLIGEMDKIVAQYHPYAVMFQTTICSACYAELARLGVVSTGGMGFSDKFHDQLAPYSYDSMMSATDIADNFTDWWCHQMTSQGGSGRTAIFAGTQNSLQNFTKQARVLGIVSTNDPDNEDLVTGYLIPELQHTCGESVTHTYFYAQNINTAAQQSNAATQAMDTQRSPATSVLCLCDPVAPQFGFNSDTDNNYWPEGIFASDQTLDFDSTGQTYTTTGSSPTLACPEPARGCGADGSIGLQSTDPQPAIDQFAASKIYALETGSKSYPLAAPIMEIFWDNWNLLATLMENTGPYLTAARMQQAAPQVPPRGGGTTGHVLRVFRPGHWCWDADVQVVYWNKHTTSPYNGAPGHYIPIEGGRMSVGQFATMSEPPAPPATGRS